MEGHYYILAFDSTHDAMTAERSLACRLPVRMMPTLRQITASCGISLRVETVDFQTLQRVLSEGVILPGTCRLYRVAGAHIWAQNGQEGDS